MTNKDLIQKLNRIADTLFYTIDTMKTVGHDRAIPVVEKIVSELHNIIKDLKETETQDDEHN